MVSPERKSVILTRPEEQTPYTYAVESAIEVIPSCKEFDSRHECSQVFEILADEVVDLLRFVQAPQDHPNPYHLDFGALAYLYLPRVCLCVSHNRYMLSRSLAHSFRQGKEMSMMWEICIISVLLLEVGMAVVNTKHMTCKLMRLTGPRFVLTG